MLKPGCGQAVPVLLFPKYLIIQTKGHIMNSSDTAFLNVSPARFTTGTNKETHWDI